MLFTVPRGKLTNGQAAGERTDGQATGERTESQPGRANGSNTPAVNSRTPARGDHLDAPRRSIDPRTMANDLSADAIHRRP
ncbi:hypothetical protein [Halorubrum vacuolatum]|uniref:hypothetical protein n=1 Tax=Halorubrum vacuolatum TaxID=63740 RepID=UPI000B796C1C|nr:hypothetical protein [Halorubrum vacuolatum]